jgi:hypothetical protein
MKNSWTHSEIKLLKKLNSPYKIQDYIFHLKYNPDSSTASPRVVMERKSAHCFEGALLAAAALEFHGERPLILDLVAHNDDDHVITLYKYKNKWGALSKTNTTTAGMRLPVYKSVRELVMSYFDFYFNTKGDYSLHKYSTPINLNRLNHYHWRTTNKDLITMGYELNKFTHIEILSKKELAQFPRAYKKTVDGTFFKSMKSGLYQP